MKRFYYYLLLISVFIFRYRKRITPELNFDATSLPEMITWEQYPDNRPHYESILTVDIPTPDLWKLLEDKLEVPDWPCHSQAVERYVITSFLSR